MILQAKIIFDFWHLYHIIVTMRKKKKRNQLCAICGKPINGNSSKEHVFPRAIAKWTEEYIEPKEYIDLIYAIESDDNIVKTHPDCNYEKSDSIISIEELHLIEDERAGLESVYSEIEPYIEKYLSIKRDILASQDGKCYLCKKELSDEGILRRLDRSKPRILENGGVMCVECSDGFSPR